MMNQANTTAGQPALGMCACDEELFQRVWQRVMPEQRPECPIVVDTAEPVHTAPAQTGPAPQNEEGNASELPAGLCPCLLGREAESVMEEQTPQGAAVSETPAPEAPEEDTTVPVEAREPEPEQPPDAAPSQAPTGDDFPQSDAVPCLGSGSAVHGGQLQEDILTALEGWQLYRHLARRVTGNPSRTLSALASEKHRQARKLAAAYFLISGMRYWPTDKLDAPRTNSWLGTLRRRFTAEQRMDSRFRAAALDTDDPCLADLYTELAEECANHAGVLRTLLEHAL